MNILILGHKGYLGSYLANYLNNLGYKIFVIRHRILIKHIRKKDNILFDGIDKNIFILINCLGSPSVSTLDNKNFLSLFNFGTYSDENEINDFNISEAITFISNKLEIKKVIHLSSEYVYGGGFKIYQDNDKPNPSTNYGLIKSIIENKIKNNQDFSSLVLRLPIIIDREFFNTFKENDNVNCDFQFRSSLSRLQFSKLVEYFLSNFQPGIINVANSFLTFKPSIYKKLAIGTSSKINIKVVFPRKKRPIVLWVAQSEIIKRSYYLSSILKKNDYS